MDLDEQNYIKYSQKVKDVAWKMEQTADWKKAHAVWKKESSKISGLPHHYGSPFRDQKPSSGRDLSDSRPRYDNRPRYDGRLQFDSDGDVIMNSARQSRGKPQTRGNGSRGRGSTPIGASSNRRAKFVSQEERDRRRMENRCLRCGASSHFIKECPYRPAIPPDAPRATGIAHVEPLLDEDDRETGTGVSDDESLN